MNALARHNESMFLHRINILGDPMLNEPYGYAFGQGGHAFLFLNNANFDSRHEQLPISSNLGLTVSAGQRMQVVSHFPEHAALRRPDGSAFRSGDTLDLWLRPFESLLLELNSNARDEALPVRAISDQAAAELGVHLALQPSAHDGNLDARFADAAAFASKGFKQHDVFYQSTLPEFGNDLAVLAVVVRLRRGEAEWKYAPTVEQIVQPILRIDGENVQMVPVPDGRQYGNTQSFGCSWVVYKIRLSKSWSGKPLQLAVHSWLPDDVQPDIQAWVDRQWWQDETRPVADGYYTDAPQ
jgi:hypothetical protein